MLSLTFYAFGWGDGGSFFVPLCGFVGWILFPKLSVYFHIYSYSHFDSWNCCCYFLFFVLHQQNWPPNTHTHKFMHIIPDFECTQTSSYHFIILFVSISVCGIVYQLSVCFSYYLFGWTPPTYEVGFVTGYDFGLKAFFLFSF